MLHTIDFSYKSGGNGNMESGQIMNVYYKQNI